MKDIFPRDPKLTKNQRIALLELELALRVRELAVYTGLEAVTQEAAEVHRELHAGEAHILALSRRMIRKAMKMIRQGRPEDAIDALSHVMDALKPSKPPKGAVV